MTDLPTDDELLAALAPLSLRSTLDPPPLPVGSRGALAAAADAGDLVAHYQPALFTSPFAAPDAASVAVERQVEVAASVAFQAVVGQVVNPVLLAHRVMGVGLDVHLADVRWRADGWATRFGLAELRRVDPMPLVGVITALQRQVVDPLLALVIPLDLARARTLRGNARAALWTAVRAVDVHAPLTEAEWTAADGAGLGPTRDTCCLIHQAGLQPCDECPFA